MEQTAHRVGENGRGTFETMQEAQTELNLFLTKFKDSFYGSSLISD